MPTCLVELEGPIQRQFSDGPGLVFRLVPEGFAYQNDCTVRIYINGAEVSGTGDFGGCHVTGKGGDFIAVQPVPDEIKDVVFAVDCADCQCRRRASWRKGYAPTLLEKVLVKLFLIFWLFPILGLGMVGAFGWVGAMILLFFPFLYLEDVLKGRPGFIAFLKKLKWLLGNLLGKFEGLLASLWKGLWHGGRI